MGASNLHDELRNSTKHVIVQTKYGEIIGARACTGAAAFLGSSWIFSQELRVQNFSVVRGSICVASRAVSRPETLTSRISVPKESVHHWVGVRCTTHERWPGTKQDYNYLHNHPYWVAAIGRSFENKVGHGQPTENPYVMRVSYCDLSLTKSDTGCFWISSFLHHFLPNAIFQSEFTSMEGTSITSWDTSRW